MFVSPFGRSATLLFLKDSVEIGPGREAALGRNDVVAIVGIIQHHPLSRIEADLAEPYTEGGIHALVEEGRQIVLGYAKCT